MKLNEGPSKDDTQEIQIIGQYQKNTDHQLLEVYERQSKINKSNRLIK